MKHWFLKRWHSRSGHLVCKYHTPDYTVYYCVCPSKTWKVKR